MKPSFRPRLNNLKVSSETTADHAPLAEISAPTTPHPPAESPISKAVKLQRALNEGIHILLLEESAVCSKIMERQLIEAGYVVTIAEAMEEAVELLRSATQGAYSIILSNIFLETQVSYIILAYFLHNRYMYMYCKQNFLVALETERIVCPKATPVFNEERAPHYSYVLLP